MRNSLRNTVTIQLVSDLHLETPFSKPDYDGFELPVKAPHLALLGDVGNTNDDRLFRFFEKQLRRFETVFFLLGNHEPYKSSFDEALERVLRFESENGMTRALQPELGRFVFLDRVRYDIPGTNVTILGCTLFSYVPTYQYLTVSRAVNDFSSKYAEGLIKDWTVDTHNAAHSLDLNWLNEQVALIEQGAPDREVAVFTHHSPTKLPAANRSDYLKDERQILSAFATDLSKQRCWQSPLVRLWSFGHTHFNCDFVEDQTGKGMRVLTNQKGYAGKEAPGFDGGLTVRLGSGSGHVHVATVREAQRYSYPGSIPTRSGSKRSSRVQSPTTSDPPPSSAVVRTATGTSGVSAHRPKPSYSSSKHSSLQRQQGNLPSSSSEAARQGSSSGAGAKEKPGMDRTAYNKALREQKIDARRKEGCCGSCVIL